MKQAKKQCVKKKACKGITKEYTGRYTLRKGTKFKTSPHRNEAS